MNRGPLDRLAGWLSRPEIARHDPDRIAALAAALEGTDPPVSAGRHGALTCYEAAPRRRRLLEFDRRGHLVAALRWTEDGGLLWAKCRSATGTWLGIEPGTGEAAWGRSDRLWRLRDGAPWAPTEIITVFQALDYERLDFIPPLAEPRRLPPGAGTTVLNLLAGLMKDQGRARVRYRGPYPTEQLFTALLECFRYDPAEPAPLDRFLAGGHLDWLPAPHERHHVGDRVYVQLRQEIDKVVVDGVAFYRADWQGVIRREPRVVRASADKVICSLWALGRPLEDRLVLDRSGEVLAAPPFRDDTAAPAPLAAVWSAALADLIARESHRALAPAIRQVMDGLALEWGPVPGDLLRVDGSACRISRRLRDAALAEVRQAAPGPERAERAIAFVLEVARLLGSEVRVRAQERLEALAEAEQQQLWEESSGAPPAGLDTSVGRLLALVAGGSA
jgi:hypothetical protein